MKKISNASFTLQHKLADMMIMFGIASGYGYKQRLDERLTFTLTAR